MPNPSENNILLYSTQNEILPHLIQHEDYFQSHLDKDYVACYLALSFQTKFDFFNIQNGAGVGGLLIPTNSHSFPFAGNESVTYPERNFVVSYPERGYSYIRIGFFKQDD